MTPIPAVYENGVFRPTGPVPLAEGTPVQVTAAAVTPSQPDPDSPGQRIARRVREIRASHPTGPVEPSAECVSRDHDKILYDELQR